MALRRTAGRNDGSVAPDRWWDDDLSALSITLDRRIDFVDDGRAALGGDPRRLMRFSAAGARVVRRWFAANGVVDVPESGATRDLADRLVEIGMAHPVARRTATLPESDVASPMVDVIVPVRDRVEMLAVCLKALSRCEGVRVTVVDDGSSNSFAHRAVADEFDAEYVRRERSGGPSSARMAGVAATEGEFVAFIDSDVVVASGWLEPLMGLFDDPRVAVVAPRVSHGDTSPSLLARFESARSPLDLGRDRAPIRAGTRVSYVPAAALVVRRSALAAVGGFDVSLAVGEDVDLVWRLNDAGWICRFEPESVVEHTGRDEWSSLLKRRFDYGRSAAVLDVRHHGDVAPVVGSPWSYGVVGLAVSGHPLMASAVAAWTAREMERKLSTLSDSRRVACRLVLQGHVGLARQLARALVRPWFPLTLSGALWGSRSVSRRRRLYVVAAAVAVGPLAEWRERRPAIDPIRWVGCCVADDVAYSAGVWAGCLRLRRWSPLLPRWRAEQRDR